MSLQYRDAMGKSEVVFIGEPATKYAEHLKMLGISEGKAERLFHIDRRVARRLAAGRGDIPSTVLILLRLLLAKKVTIDEVAAAAISMSRVR